MSAPLVQVGPSDGLDVTAPLLDPEIRASASEASPSHGDIWVVTPLPKRQVAVIAFAALAEPVCVNFIYPFINEMIGGMSKGPKQLAFRSGIFFGCFSLAQFCCVYFWGTLSDRLGRKPVLLLCLACGAISTALFGISTTFIQALILRIITGASYGDVPVLRSAMGDITDSTNQARAFSFIPLTWAIGSTLAPLMGGFLSHPAKHFPERFGNSQFLKDHPYALPCFVSSAISLLAFSIIALFFRESLPPHSEHLDDEASANADETASKGSNEPPLEDNAVDAGGSRSQTPLGPAVPNYGSTSESHAPLPRNSSRPSSPILNEPEPISGFTGPPGRNSAPRPSAFKILTDPIVRVVLLSYFSLALISTANDVIFALWMYLSIENGGVGLKPTQIATALSAGSILQTLIIVFLFPLLHRRFGTLTIYRCAMALDVVLIGCYPIVHLIAQSTVKHHHSDHDNTGQTLNFLLVALSPKKERGGIIGVWNGVPGGLVGGIATMLIVKAFAGLTWGCNMILVTASAPTPRSLGAVNSMAQMAASLGRTIGPPVYSSIFALSMSKSILGGKGLIWIFMGTISSISLIISFFVREGEQDWRRSRRAP